MISDDWGFLIEDAEEGKMVRPNFGVKLAVDAHEWSKN